jgi:predicted Fe-Mo cluster-binding NifX family protein
MGTQAQKLFRSNGVIVITGVQSDHPQRAILSWLNGELPQGTNACDH